MDTTIQPPQILEINCGEDEEEGEAAYPDVEEVTLAEKRRAFVLQYMASPDIDGKILCANCTLMEKWLIDGASEELSIPEKKPTKSKSVPLKALKKEKSEQETSVSEPPPS